MSKQKADPAKDPEVRKTGIGGSDLAKMFNESDYGNERDLYLEKRGLVVPEDISEKGVIKRGNKLEPIIAEEFAEEKSLTLIDPMKTIRGDRPWMMAHPDRMFKNPKGKWWGLEIKTATREIFMRNTRIGLDFPYLLQCVYYLYITKASGWVLRMKHPDSWKDHDFIIRRSAHTDSIWEQIQKKGDRFWNYVEEGILPPDVTKGDGPTPQPLPEDSGVVAVDGPEFDDLGAMLYEAQQIKKSADYTLGLAKEAVKTFMEANGWTLIEGPVKTMTGPRNLRVFLREQKGRTTYKGKEAVELLGRVKELLDNNETDELIELMSAYDPSLWVKVGKPSTPFKPFWIKTTVLIGDKS